MNKKYIKIALSAAIIGSSIMNGQNSFSFKKFTDSIGRRIKKIDHTYKTKVSKFKCPKNQQVLVTFADPQNTSSEQIHIPISTRYSGKISGNKNCIPCLSKQGNGIDLKDFANTYFIDGQNNQFIDTMMEIYPENYHEDYQCKETTHKLDNGKTIKYSSLAEATSKLQKATGINYQISKIELPKNGLRTDIAASISKAGQEIKNSGKEAANEELAKVIKQEDKKIVEALYDKYKKSNKTTDENTIANDDQENYSNKTENSPTEGYVHSDQKDEEKEDPKDKGDMDDKSNHIN
jgi:hypothetical protein